MRRRYGFVLIVGAFAPLMLSCDSHSADPVEELPRQRESEHFVLYYAPGDHVDATWQDGYHEWLMAALDVEMAQKIHYFKYRDRAHLRRVTGKNTNGYAESDAFRFHTIWPIDNHEMVHVVVFNTIGRASALFDEGMAVAHQTDPSGADVVPRWSGRSVHDIARDHHRAGTIPTMDALLESTSFREVDPNVTYPLAGSFVRFLIDDSGLGTMKGFTARSSPDDRSATIRNRFRAAYGEEVDQAWERWLDFLGKE